MADPGPSPTSEVSLLVPHPTRTAVLVADPPATMGLAPARVQLPVLRLGTDDPLLPDIVTAIEGLDVAAGQQPLVLRQVVLSSGSGHDGEGLADARVMELEPTTLDAPPGWAWLDLDAKTLAGLEPGSSKSALASWGCEREDGWMAGR